ncbi:MAG: hypothetical protein JWL77_4268 [Chthonomonadaceae bacterium]|nr:hypothetical protein [Chthonomonadaceae bacterium]
MAPALLLGAVALGGCTRTVNRTAERKIRDVLPDVLGPARQYRAHVDSAPENTVHGRLAAVTIDGDDVQIPNGLLLDQIHLELKGIDLDTKAQRVRSVREARFTATVGENSLNEFLAGEAPDGETIQKLNLTLNAGRVTLAAERVVLGVGVPFSFTGPLRLLPPRRIELDPTRFVVVGIPITGKPLQFLKERFENSLDLSALPFPVQITSVTTTKGLLTLSGTADVAALLRQAQERRPR